MKESYLWSQFKEAMAGFAHASRIENTAGNGMSDVNLCKNGKEIWVELKMFKGRRLHFRNSQLSWICSRHNFGGRIFVVARNDDSLFAYDAYILLSRNPHRPETPQSFSIQADDPGTMGLLWRSAKPFRWQELREVLFVTDLKQEAILSENS